MKTMLTENFSLAEMTGGMNPATVPHNVRDNLRFLCTNYLEPLREHCQKPIIVNSAYRTPAANTAAGGSSPTSLHLEGLAADIRCATFYEACEVLNFFIARWLHHGIGFHEAYVSFNRSWWLHLAVRRNPADNQLRVRLDWRGRIYI